MELLPRMMIQISIAVLLSRFACLGTQLVFCGFCCHCRTENSYPFLNFLSFFYMIILCDCSQDRWIDGIPYWRLDFSCLCSLVPFSLAVSLLMEVTCGQLMLASFENCLLRTSQHKQMKSRFLEPFSTTIRTTGILLAHICLSLGVLWLAYLK